MEMAIFDYLLIELKMNKQTMLIPLGFYKYINIIYSFLYNRNLNDDENFSPIAGDLIF